MHTLRRSRSSASQCPTPLRKKLVVLGDANTGKTFLLYRINHDKYADKYSRTIEFADYVKFEDSCQVRLMLVDTNQYYDRLFPLYCASTDVVLMCFAIDTRDSLDNVANYWKAEVLDKHCQNVPVILVGTKMDLRCDEQQRKNTLITRDEALRVAETIGAVSYLECSAKLGDGVREIFDYAVQLVVHAAKGVKADRRKSKCVLS